MLIVDLFLVVLTLICTVIIRDGSSEENHSRSVHRDGSSLEN